MGSLMGLPVSSSSSSEPAILSLFMVPMQVNRELFKSDAFGEQQTKTDQPDKCMHQISRSPPGDSGRRQRGWQLWSTAGSKATQGHLGSLTCQSTEVQLCSICIKKVENWGGRNLAISRIHFESYDFHSAKTKQKELGKCPETAPRNAFQVMLKSTTYLYLYLTYLEIGAYNFR